MQAHARRTMPPIFTGTNPERSSLTCPVNLAIMRDLEPRISRQCLQRVCWRFLCSEVGYVRLW